VGPPSSAWLVVLCEILLEIKQIKPNTWMRYVRESSRRFEKVREGSRRLARRFEKVRDGSRRRALAE
jgi:hypothetical protein